MKRIAAGLREIYGPETIRSQFAFDLWCKLLCGYPAVVVEAAAAKYCETGHFPPKPSDILDIIKQESVPEVDYTETIAEIRHSIRYLGWTNEAKAKEQLSSFAWKMVERMGGWQACCSGSFDDTTTRAQFRDMHKAVISQMRSDITGIEARTPDMIGEKHD